MPEVDSRDVGEPTAPYTPLFDTGTFAAQPDPVRPLAAEFEPTGSPVLVLDEELPPEPMVIPAQPVAVEGTYQYLKRWVFALTVAGVWVAGAAIGAGLYYWWFRSMDKTAAVFGVLMFLIVCAVSSPLIAQVRHKPVVSALAISLMSAPFAAMAGAAGLYGAYVFGWITP